MSGNLPPGTTQRDLDDKLDELGYSPQSDIDDQRDQADHSDDRWCYVCGYCGQPYPCECDEDPED